MAGHFGHIYVAGRLSEKMKENFGQADNVTVIKLEDVATIIHGSQKDVFFITDYEAMLDIQYLFTNLGAIEPFWEKR